MKIISSFIVLILFFGSLHLLLSVGAEIPLKPDKNFPRWLTADSVRTDQTSGITFLKEDEGKKIFLLADDIGDLWRLSIARDTIFNLKKLVFSGAVQNYLAKFPKKDFEEIAYDKFTGDVFVSIEGNVPSIKEYVGIYQLKFSGNNFFADTIVSFKKIQIEPKKLFLKYIGNNIGYEGLAVSEKYLFLGLEGFEHKSIFSDCSMIFIVDKASKRIIKQLNTRNYKIQTICGLFCEGNNTLWGIDRNNAKIFRIKLNEKLDISELTYYDAKGIIPNYKDYNYGAALESITMDNNANLYLVDDPWKKVFIPSTATLENLDTLTRANFTQFTPIIYKYKVII
ncbi:MAG: hypothetical protein COW85_02265 [Ignavibacteria bacterium CG22_combo_CG10-13_8_21_14_all_37_15]|nr:MAG: hypothetical protein COW85_02265 [Ignavibacteria bacterium CG22_combo_CG10-13_8_21_14_all_37_15]